MHSDKFANVPTERITIWPSFVLHAHRHCLFARPSVEPTTALNSHLVIAFIPALEAFEGHFSNLHAYRVLCYAHSAERRR
jgi:hypothetical protein